MKYLLPIFLLCFFSTCAPTKGKSSLEKLPARPVNISFLNKDIPDSVRDFANTCLLSKKIKVIDWKEGIQLFGEATNRKMKELIDTKKLDQQTAGDFAKQMDVIYNILQIRLYRNTPSGSQYKIDSIYWRVLIVPTMMDTNTRMLRFIPTADDDPEPHQRIKKFIAEVLSSGYLK